jgi:hypothetical protein
LGMVSKYFKKSRTNLSLTGSLNSSIFISSPFLFVSIYITDYVEYLSPSKKSLSWGILSRISMPITKQCSLIFLLKSKIEPLYIFILPSSYS